MSTETDLSDLVQAVNSPTSVEASLGALFSGIAGLFRSLSSPVTPDAEKIATTIENASSIFIAAVKNNTPAQAIPVGATSSSLIVTVTSSESAVDGSTSLSSPSPTAPPTLREFTHFDPNARVVLG